MLLVSSGILLPWRRSSGSGKLMRRILALFVLIVAAAWFVPRAALPILRANARRPAVEHRSSTVERIVLAASDAGLPPRIAVLRFWHESRWQHMRSGRVIESMGNCGIAQLNRRYTKGACSMTEEQSIREGVRQLAGYWREFGSVGLTVTAYTKGPGVARGMKNAKR